MQPKSVWEYIALGIDIGSLRFSQIIPEEWKQDALEVDMSVISPDELMDKFERLNLLGARGIARLIKSELKSERARHFTDISVHYLDALISALESESERIQVFTVSQTRLDATKLLNNPSALLAPGVFNLLHEVAQYDFAQAGKCIAFDLPTSAAFHLMRGTEMVLRQFYFAITGKHADEKNWGPIVKDLRTTETPVLTPLYDHLDNIRTNFRNPTQHPDKIYDIEEVQDLFSLCVDVVDRMVPLIQQKQDKNAE